MVKVSPKEERVREILTGRYYSMSFKIHGLSRYGLSAPLKTTSKGLVQESKTLQKPPIPGHVGYLRSPGGDGGRDGPAS